jgi:hypothetical protein
VTFVTHINTAGIGMYDRETGIVASQTPSQIPALLPVHLTAVQPLEGGSFSLCHGILLSSEIRPRLGSACENTTGSPTGSERTFFKAGPPPINTSLQPKSRYYTGTKAPTKYRP